MAHKHVDSFGTRKTLTVGSQRYDVFRLDLLEKAGLKNISKLPVSMKVLLENLLRQEDNHHVNKNDIEALANWNPRAKQDKEIAFMPARVLTQDLTGVPAVVDLAVMREAMKRLGGDPKKINPLVPVDLIIDHSVQVDTFGTANAFHQNSELEFQRNAERYACLRWGQKAFSNFKVVPPDTGICHQVNLEYLGQVVFRAKENGAVLAYPDTLVGMDSHTTMINGLGVVGWGVGGIEAEAALLGQPIIMLIPEVIGFKLHGRLPAGATSTDLVLTVTQMLRKKGVVEKFVEFYGAGLSSLSVADRATIGNMSPEYGATIGFFPPDDETLKYLQLTGRDPELIKLVEAYCKEQGLFRTDASPDPIFTDTLELDLATVEPSLAGPRRPQDRVPLANAKSAFQEALPSLMKGGTPDRTVAVNFNGDKATLGHGTVVISAITSCTNTSNPSVLIGAGLLAKKAVEKGLKAKPWVKTSLAPGSKVVTDYLKETGLMPYLEKLGFYLVGYGCTTCLGNSGPLPEPITAGIQEGDLVACAVLSGNRNFEGRIHPQVRANYLASPPLVVAYALTGRMDIDLYQEPLGADSKGSPVYLKDIWPAPEEIHEEIRKSVSSEMFKKAYSNVFEGDERWKKMPTPEGELFKWDADSTYVREAPYFEGMTKTPSMPKDITGARVLAVLGDSITTDHISPVGSIERDGPAARYLMEHGVQPKDFNQYGARRGNHEVMMRGTFANVRLKNFLAPGTEGGWSVHLPDKKPMFIYDAAMQYQKEGVPLIVIAGKEYGTGSSRDWAAK
jgi:aconitate hydratase